MTEKLGGIVYDDQAALYPGAEYPENDNVKTEILVMDSDLEILSKEEDFEEKIPSERELEARMIAMRIRELLRSQKVTDKETGTSECVLLGYCNPDEVSKDLPMYLPKC